MDGRLIFRLRKWRTMQAAREGVEPYLVLSNATLEAIAFEKPLTKEAFFAIKGFKDAKWRKYGAMLLPMTSDETEEYPVMKNQEAHSKQIAEIFQTEELSETVLKQNVESVDEVYSVSSFLDLLNDSFAGLAVRIQGEVSSVDERERTTYFSLKDPTDGSTVSCLIFQSAYRMSGVRLEIGQEIIIEGRPEIWKPTGRMSMKVAVIELAGEGALKKAYDELKRKLEFEGLFTFERKRSLPELPERIALITSSQGAAIGDFMMNVGSFGYKISLYNSSVEGQRAVGELLQAVRYFNRHAEQYDVLVIIRGGGSLESLQAFNNEVLVREVAASKIPVLAGIGHEKDVSLVALVADSMVSTPTATARALRESWERAAVLLDQFEHALIGTFQEVLYQVGRNLESKAVLLVAKLSLFRERFSAARHAVIRAYDRIGFALQDVRERVVRSEQTLTRIQSEWLISTQNRLREVEGLLESRNPERLLKLGFSLMYREGKVVRSAKEIHVGDRVEVRFSEGSAQVEIKETTI